MAMMKNVTIFVCTVLSMLGNHVFLCSADQGQQASNLERLQFPRNRIGPTGVNFDSQDNLYAATRNGKILKYLGPSNGFVDFAYTIANSSKEQCDDITGMQLEKACGRPVRLWFYPKTRDLYFTDAYYFLRSVGPDGGVSSVVADSAEGARLNFLTGLFLDNDNDILYFTQVSTVYGKDRREEALRNNDSFGRVLKYDIPRRQVTVLLRGLNGPAGVALSKDKSFLLFTEFVTNKIRKYWLMGPKANTTETVITLPGRPNNIKINSNGMFWVAVLATDEQDNTVPLGYLIGADGTHVLKILDFRTVNVNSPVNEVYEYKSKLYLSSQYLDYVGVMPLQDSDY